MKFSFIIPVYNSENYIERCIKSVVEQNWNRENYEIVIINDGSTDFTENKIKQLSNMYHNIIKYYNQKNMGVSAARNSGIKKSKGEYIIFVDSDDIIPKDFLNNIGKFLEDKNYDVIKCGVKCVEQKKYDNRFNLPIFENLSGSKALLTFCQSNKIFATPWSYILRRDFIIKEKLFFVNNVLHEDYGLIPLVIFKANSVASVDFDGYIYIKRKDSIVTSSDDISEIKRIKDFIFHTKRLILYFKRNDNTEENKIICNYFIERLNIKLNNLSSSVRNKIDDNILKELKEVKNYE